MSEFSGWDRAGHSAETPADRSRRIRLALGLALSAALSPLWAVGAPVAFWEVLADQRLKQSLSPENQPQLRGGLLAWVDRDSLRFAALERVYTTNVCRNDGEVYVKVLPAL